MSGDSDPIELVAYDQRWVELFGDVDEAGANGEPLSVHQCSWVWALGQHGERHVNADYLSAGVRRHPGHSSAADADVKEAVAWPNVQPRHERRA